MREGSSKGEGMFVRKKTTKSGKVNHYLVETCREKGKVRLEPANSSMQPIVLDESKNPNTEILGVLVGVLRKC